MRYVYLQNPRMNVNGEGHLPDEPTRESRRDLTSDLVSA
jgi:hypothetical protein